MGLGLGLGLGLDGCVDVVRVLVAEVVRVVEALFELAVTDERVAERARVVAEGRAPLGGGRAIDCIALATAHGEAWVGVRVRVRVRVRVML